MAVNGIGNGAGFVRGREFQIQVDNQFENKQIPSLNPPSGSDNTTSFADSLNNAVKKVDGLQKTADSKIQDLVTGKSSNIHETMIAVEKADIALKLMTQVRNKIIDAYQEVMKMQV